MAGPRARLDHALNELVIVHALGAAARPSKLARINLIVAGGVAHGHEMIIGDVGRVPKRWEAVVDEGAWVRCASVLDERVALAEQPVPLELLGCLKQKGSVELHLKAVPVLPTKRRLQRSGWNVIALAGDRRAACIRGECGLPRSHQLSFGHRRLSRIVAKDRVE